ncbi:MAG: hypothetical protein ACQETB_00255 [Halobacteriota archaeon]
MRPRTKSSLLWGVVGAMSFGVLAQGYVLVGGTVPIGSWGLLLGGGAVAVATVAVTYAIEYRLLTKGRT